MSRDPSPLWARLGAELRRVRQGAGLPQSVILDRQPTVSDVENGLRLPTEAQVEAWLVHAGRADAEAIRELHAAALSETRVWSSLLAGDPTGQRTAAEEEAGAVRVRSYQNEVIPGLLQTSDYAAALFTHLGREDVWPSVTGRMARQAILDEPGRSFQFLIMEHVLDCAIAPHARAGQMARLARLVGEVGVSIGVVPESVLPAESFLIFDPRDGAPHVTMETAAGLSRFSAQAWVEAYEAEWARLWSGAYTGADASAAIRTRAQRGERG